MTKEYIDTKNTSEAFSTLRPSPFALCPKKVAVLGSTGSIGTQALDVIREHPEAFEAYVLTANNQVELLIQQAREFLPEIVVIANEEKYAQLKEGLSDLPIKVWAGSEAVAQAAETEAVDVVLTALVGYSGLQPTLSAIKAGKTIALANKETLVIAGELITRLALEYRTPILPVDSEHSAIFQCLVGELDNPIEKILLTASGGPFRTFSLAQLKHVTKKEALKHPNWDMGAKVTIDSASLMNKGFEMIEAKWLFGVNPDQIQVLVHPQSIIHSMVQFEDASVKAQLGVPDMKLPIQYALAYPHRLPSHFDRLDFKQFHTLTFEEPDTSRFRNLNFAFEAIKKGGNMPCIMNAANEIAVAAFLQDKTGFLQMSDVIEETMQTGTFIATPSYEDYIQTNTEARIKAEELIKKIWKQY
jgi:1-deoxy-D-xylulose-5-phosphate reductoisomerase